MGGEDRPTPSAIYGLKNLGLLQCPLNAKTTAKIYTSTQLYAYCFLHERSTFNMKLHVYEIVDNISKSSTGYI